MGSELVSDSCSQNGNSFRNELVSFSFTQQFYRHLPFYLSIGMTYDQYWNENCELTQYYRKALEIRNQRKNQEMWLQGMYIYDALCKVSPVLHAFAKNGTKPLEYPSEPYPLTQKELIMQKERQEKKNRSLAKAIFSAWADNLELKDQTNGGETNGNDN